MKLWRETIRQLFYNASGVFPARLGRQLTPTIASGGLVNTPRFQDILRQYPQRYRALLGDSLLGNLQVDSIHALLLEGCLYAGSDGSEKDGIGAHAYGFTSGRELGKVWGGAAITPGNREEMASLRAELGGAIGILLVIYALQVQRGVSDQMIAI